MIFDLSPAQHIQLIASTKRPQIIMCNIMGDFSFCVTLLNFKNTLIFAIISVVNHNFSSVEKHIKISEKAIQYPMRKADQAHSIID